MMRSWDALSALANRNEVTLIWMPGHCGMPGNEKTDELGQSRCSNVTTGPRAGSWNTQLQHCIAWKNLPGHRHGKLFVSRPCKKRTEDLLKLSRLQLRMVFAFLTGHASVKKHLNIMGRFDGDPNCRFWRSEIETVYHIMCCCEALARQHCNFFRQFFAEPKDISTALLKRPVSLCKAQG